VRWPSGGQTTRARAGLTVNLPPSREKRNDPLIKAAGIANAAVAKP